MKTEESTIPKIGGISSLLELPPELNSNERLFDVHEVLRKLSKERLREVCGMLPINAIDLAAPGSSEPMKHAVQSIFLVATYVISNGIARDIADSVITPLVARIEHFGSSYIHPELGTDEIFNLALDMSRNHRDQEAIRCLDVLEGTVVKLQRPVLFLKYMTLHNKALDSGEKQDIKLALSFYETTTELHKDSNVRQAVEYLRNKQ